MDGLLGSHRVPQIAQKLVITSGKNQGKRPSVATTYRILAKGETVDLRT